MDVITKKSKIVTRSQNCFGTLNTGATLAVGRDSGLFRVMTWNIEGLGGGFRKPKRQEEIIKSTAEVIKQVDPEICTIIEVMKYTRPNLPKKPVSDLYIPDDNEYGEVDEEYELALKQWEVKCQKAINESQTSNKHPGVDELLRILNYLGGEWSLWVPEITGSRAYTLGETYGFFYKNKIVKPTANCVFIDVGFPQYRQPLLQEFIVSGSLFPMGGKAWNLGVIAFHAPSPSHNKQPNYDVEVINKNLGIAAHKFANNFNLLLIAADTNLDTMGQDRGAQAWKIIEEIENYLPLKYIGCDLMNARTSLRRSENLWDTQYDNAEIVSGFDFVKDTNSSVQNWFDFGQKHIDDEEEFIQGIETDVEIKDDPPFYRTELPEDFTSAAFDKMIAFSNNPNILSQSLKVFPLLEAILDYKSNNTLFPPVKQFPEYEKDPFSNLSDGSDMNMLEDEPTMDSQTLRFYLRDENPDPYATNFADCLPGFLNWFLTTPKIKPLSKLNALLACKELSDHQPIFGDYEIKK